jgi:hypothetical protein
MVVCLLSIPEVPSNTCTARKPFVNPDSQILHIIALLFDVSIRLFTMTDYNEQNHVFIDCFRTKDQKLI